MPKAGHKLRDTPRLEKYIAAMWVLKTFAFSYINRSYENFNIAGYDAR